VCEEEDERKKRIEMNDKRFTSNTFNTAAAAAAAVRTVYIRWGNGGGRREDQVRE